LNEQLDRLDLSNLRRLDLKIDDHFCDDDDEPETLTEILFPSFQGHHW